jgi:hypothetical protein
LQSDKFLSAFLHLIFLSLKDCADSMMFLGFVIMLQVSNCWLIVQLARCW